MFCLIRDTHFTETLPVLSYALKYRILDNPPSLANNHLNLSLSNFEERHRYPPLASRSIHDHQFHNLDRRDGRGSRHPD